ncbi:MAG: hypothetical protein EOP07_01290 [Proteobacteria bacterium]|jgi:flagellar motor component MotA|nr:MAG: hypothetical protein EOP07_01290 [Pseudomonadota bacterium]
MDLKERLKKAGRVLLYGTIWVYVLSIPVGEKLLFDHAYDVLVENSVVNAIQREVKSAWRDAKGKARSALADSENEIPKEVETEKF